jgi:hypothetical protein
MSPPGVPRTSPLDGKALVAIAVLMGLQATWSVITYGELAKRIGHPQYALSDILDRVTAWCRKVKRQSLALLVISAEGEPNEGIFRPLPGDSHSITPENYLKRRVDLWSEDWSDVVLPTAADEIATIYAQAYE